MNLYLKSDTIDTHIGEIPIFSLCVKFTVKTCFGIKRNIEIELQYCHLDVLVKNEITKNEDILEFMKSEFLKNQENKRNGKKITKTYNSIK